jgi:hypothetical protein
VLGFYDGCLHFTSLSHVDHFTFFRANGWSI